jgi:hypothetical protein
MGQPAAASGVKKVFGCRAEHGSSTLRRHEVSLAVFGFGPGRASKSKESAVLAGSFASPTFLAVSGKWNRQSATRKSWTPKESGCSGNRWCRVFAQRCVCSAQRWR